MCVTGNFISLDRDVVKYKGSCCANHVRQPQHLEICDAQNNLYLAPYVTHFTSMPFAHHVYALFLFIA